MIDGCGPNVDNNKHGTPKAGYTSFHLVRIRANKFTDNTCTSTCQNSQKFPKTITGGDH